MIPRNRAHSAVQRALPTTPSMPPWAFQALRERLRCKEIWVVGADRWRNSDEDLPKDFERRRGEHYAALCKPLDPTAFVASWARR